MPALPPAPNALKLIHTYKIASDSNVQVHLYWKYSGAAPGPSGLSTWLAACNAAYAANLTSLHHVSVVLTELEAIDLSSDTAGTAVLAVNHPGSRSGSILAANTCLLWNGTVARRYRGGKPRAYWPFGVTADLSTNVQWTTAFTAACQTALSNYVTGVVAGMPGPAAIINLANVSYYNAGAVRPTAALVEVWTSFSSNLIPGTQRRRLRPG